MGRRAGRKRKDGPRYPSGQLKPAPAAIDDRTRTSRQPHRRMLKAEDRLDERAESPLGRLLLKMHLGYDEVGLGRGRHRVISDQAHRRYVAGQMFLRTVGEYRATIMAPRGTAGGGRGVGCVPEACASLRKVFGEDKVRCECHERQRRYDDVFCALSRDAGRKALMVLNRVVVWDQPIDEKELVYLVGALDVLVAHYGLTPGRRRTDH